MIVKLANLSINVVFLIECIVKITAYTWPKYISSPWNRLDFFLVMVAVIDVSLEYAGGSEASGASSSVRVLRILRILRALRPLRVISRSKGLRIVLGTISR